MRLDIDLLRSFAAVAETGVLGRAADRLGYTQAAISMQMKRLEEELERPLLNRTGRGVTLTVEGERLLAHARSILRSHDESVAELIGGELRGTVHLGCPDEFATVLLPPLLRAFSRRYPQVQIEVTCAPTPQLREKLRLRSIDVALLSLPDTSASEEVLRREPLVWVSRKKIDIREMQPLPLALLDRDTLDFKAATYALSEMGRSYRIAYASGGMSGLLAVVRSGLAVTVLARAVVPRDLAILRPGNALPELPGVGLSLERDRRISSSLTDALERQLRSTLSTL